MKKHNQRFISILMMAAFLVCLLIPGKVQAEEKETVTITILETSDLHGCIYPHDYATDQDSEVGLAKAATIINEEREKDPDLILCDCGDSTQGNFISDFRNDEIHPMIKAMNLLNYDVWELGNHEFNYEFKNLTREINQIDAAVLGGNIYKEDGQRFVKPYEIFEREGIKVAVFGIIAPHVTRWESDRSHYDNMTFTTPMEETGKILDELNGKADIIVGLVHYGEDGEYGVEGMAEVAAKYADRVDAFLLGHAHSVSAKYFDGKTFVTDYVENAKVVLTEPGSNGRNVSKVVLTVDKATKKAVDKTVEVISTKGVTPDAKMLKEMEYVHTKSVETANTVVGQVAEDFYEDPFWLPGIPNAVIADGPLIDLINDVQLSMTGADVSLAALFSPSSNLKKGDYKMKDGVKVYKYDNTLMAVKITGAQLKKIMERQAGNFFNQYQEGDVTISFNPEVRLYNYDMFAGVDYQIDISKPVGERIVNLKYHGEPLKDDEQLVLALNNYRYGGLSGDGIISDSPEDVVYDSAATADVPAIRDMISAYVKEQKSLVPSCDHNWEIIGYDFEYPEAEEVYEMIRNGEIVIPTSEDGRTSNVASVNINQLIADGVIEAFAEVEEEVKEEDYLIVKGDCLWKIARREGVSIDEILLLNPQIKNKNLIYAGQKLKLPA